jgi:hydrogenase nickel incorporation protein HypA/HybF
MHELAVAESVVTTIVERLGDAHVVRVRLQIGRLAAVLPDAMRFCFEVCARGTPLEGARLEIEEVAPRGRCRRCGAERDYEDALTRCVCGEIALEIVAGSELRIREVELRAIDMAAHEPK